MPALGRVLWLSKNMRVGGGVQVRRRELVSIRSRALSIPRRALMGACGGNGY